MLTKVVSREGVLAALRDWFKQYQGADTDPDDRVSDGMLADMATVIMRQAPAEIPDPPTSPNADDVADMLVDFDAEVGYLRVLAATFEQMDGDQRDRALAWLHAFYITDREF